MQDNICIGKKIRIINKSELKSKSKIRQGTDIGRKKTDNTLSIELKNIQLQFAFKNMNIWSESDAHRY